MMHRLATALLAFLPMLLGCGAIVVELDPHKGSPPTRPPPTHSTPSPPPVSKEWSGLHIGSALDDDGFDLAADAHGNLYVTGSFHNQVKLGATTLSSAPKLASTFVAKLNPKGEVVWARSFSGTSSNWGFAIAASPKGSLYLTGKMYQGELRFGAKVLKTTRKHNMYLAKMTTDGGFLWIRNAGDGMIGWGSNVVADAQDRVYVIGSFQGKAAFDSKTLDTGKDTVFYTGNLFLARFDPEGRVQWAEAVYADAEILGDGIALLPDGSLVMTGSSAGSASFGNLRIQSAFSSPIFVAKLNAEGKFLWAQTLAQTELGKGTGIAVDALGQLIVVGRFKDKALFGNQEFKASGKYAGFLAALDANGKARWVRAPVGDVVEDLFVSPGGQIFVTGSFFQRATFGDVVLRSYQYDAYIAEYNRQGEVKRALQIGGNGAFNFGRGVVQDAFGRLFATGSFSRTLKLGSLTFQSKGENPDAFVLYIPPL